MIDHESLLKKYMTVVLDVMQTDLLYSFIEDEKYQLSDGRKIRFSEDEQSILLAIQGKIIEEEIDAIRGAKMTQELFTPGPWCLHQEPFWSIRDDRLDRTILDNEPYTSWVPSNPCDWHLIAAAPELYDMVKKLVEFCPDATLANQAYTILSNARGEY